MLRWSGVIKQGGHICFVTILIRVTCAPAKQCVFFWLTCESDVRAAAAAAAAAAAEDGDGDEGVVLGAMMLRDGEAISSYSREVNNLQQLKQKR